MEQTTSHMPQLDALRALAVGAVAYSHWIPEKWHFGLPLGSGGVQLFFVLSGFLISTILIQCRQYSDIWFALRAFYARRFLRIFPLFYSLIFIAYALDIPPMRETVLWHLSYLSNFYFFFNQSWNGSISHFWSLAVEEQFYLFWPAIVLFAPTHRLLYWFLSLCVLGILSIFCIPLLFPNAKLLGVLPNYNFFALGLGSLLALRNAYPNLLRTIIACSIYSLPLYALLTITSEFDIHFTGIDQLRYLSMVVCFFWLINRASQGFTGWLGMLLEQPILMYLGRISYGIYVLHNFSDVPVSWFCRNVVGVSDLKFGVIGLALKCIATILGATISWYILEKPFNSLKAHFPYRSQRR